MCVCVYKCIYTYICEWVDVSACVYLYVCMYVTSLCTKERREKCILMFICLSVYAHVFEYESMLVGKLAYQPWWDI